MNTVPYRGWRIVTSENDRGVSCMGLKKSSEGLDSETALRETLWALFKDREKALLSVYGLVTMEIDSVEDLNAVKHKEGAPETLWES